MTYYSLMVSFPLDTRTMVSETEKVERVVGQERAGSGAGMGVRDVDFTFTSKADCEAAAERVRKEFPGHEVCWIECSNDD